MASGELSPRGTPAELVNSHIALSLTHSIFPASVASSSELSLVDPAAAGGKLLPKKDKAPGTLKLKKSMARKTKPKDGEGNGELGWYCSTTKAMGI